MHTVDATEFDTFQPLKVKGKASSLVIVPLTILDSGALQTRKWWLTGNDCSTAAQAVAAQSPR